MSLRDTRRTAAAAELGRRHPVWTLYGGPIVVGVVLVGLVGAWLFKRYLDGY